VCVSVDVAEDDNAAVVLFGHVVVSLKKVRQKSELSLCQTFYHLYDPTRQYIYRLCTYYIALYPSPVRTSFFFSPVWFLVGANNNKNIIILQTTHKALMCPLNPAALLTINFHYAAVTLYRTRETTRERRVFNSIGDYSFNASTTNYNVL
jgi:hypothetical protein